MTDRNFTASRVSTRLLKTTRRHWRTGTAASALAQAKGHGFTDSLITRDVQQALALADRAELMEDGQIALGSAADAQSGQGAEKARV